jgi:hypothetical protein
MNREHLRPGTLCIGTGLQQSVENVLGNVHFIQRRGGDKR